MFKNLGFSAKLIVVGTVLLVIPLAVVAYLAVQRSSLAISAIETEQLGRSARLVAASINDVFVQEKKLAIGQALQEEIVGAAIAPRGAALGGDAVARATDRLLAVKNQKGLGEEFETIMCVGKDGIGFAATDPSYVGVSFADRDYIKQALAGNANAGSAVLSKVTGRPVVPVAAPIRSGRRGGRCLRPGPRREVPERFHHQREDRKKRLRVRRGRTTG